MSPLEREPKSRVLGWGDRDNRGSNLKSLSMGCWKKWGPLLALMLSLGFHCGLLTSVCLSVSHLPFSVHGISRTVLGRALRGCDGPWAEELHSAPAFGHSWTL